MRHALVFLAAAFAANAAEAQNLYTTYPESTTFTSRGFLDDEYYLVQYSADNVRGLGNVPGAANGRVLGFRGLIQDQDAATVENYRWVILPDDGNGAPDATAGNEIFDSGDIPTPGGAAGATAWFVTATLQTPADILPCEDTYYFGVRLPVPTGAGWPNDGLSAHTASFAANAAGDNPCAAAPSPRWTHNINTGASVNLSGAAIRIGMFVESAILNVGADITGAPRGPNPNFGFAGHYPDRARGDGLCFKVTDGRNAGAPYAVFGTPIGYLAGGLSLPGIDGKLLLAVPLIPTALIAGNLDANGEGIGCFAPAGFTTPIGTIQYQAAIIPAAGNPQLTNAVQSSDC